MHLLEQLQDELKDHLSCTVLFQTSLGLFLVKASCLPMLLKEKPGTESLSSCPSYFLNKTKPVCELSSPIQELVTYVFQRLVTPQCFPGEHSAEVHDSQRSPSKKESLDREQNSPGEQNHCWLFILRALSFDMFLCNTPMVFQVLPSLAPNSATPGKVMLESLVVIPQRLPRAASSTKLSRFECL